MTEVIMTADDYGVVPDINEAICDLVQVGVIHSVEVFPNYGDSGSKSVDNTLRLLHIAESAERDLELGVHLTITSGKPLVADSGLEPVMVGDSFTSYRDLEPGADPNAIYRELERQVQVFLDDQRLAPYLTHLTNHHDSLWFYEDYAKQLLKLSNTYGLPVRNPNSVPKNRIWIYYVLQNLVRSISKENKKKIREFYDERKKGKFPDSFRSTEAMNNSFYSAQYLMRQIPAQEVQDELREKKGKLKRMFRQARKDYDLIEFMFHVRKGGIYDWNGEDEVSYYSGIDPSYFDGRLMEFRGLWDNRTEIQDYFASDFNRGSWKNAKSIATS